MNKLAIILTIGSPLLGAVASRANVAVPEIELQNAQPIAPIVRKSGPAPLTTASLEPKVEFGQSRPGFVVSQDEVRELITVDTIESIYSTDPAVISVTQKGDRTVVLTAKSPGMCRVTVTTHTAPQSSKGKIQFYTVKVLPGPQKALAPSRPAAKPNRSGSDIPLAAGKARLLTTESKLLAVHISNEEFVSARAINNRTLALTGISPGTTTVTIFRARFENDVVGQSTAYTVTVSGDITAIADGATPFGETARVTVPFDTARVSKLLGITWPDSKQGFEEMLVTEIQKRDRRIVELEKLLQARSQPTSPAKETQPRE